MVPSVHENPFGWHDAGFEGSEENCFNQIKEIGGLA